MEPADSTTRRPLITVVIPAFKRRRQLELAVRSLFTQTLSPEQFEVFVVDSSPDESNVHMVNALRDQAPCRLECLSKKPEGPGPSRNLGARTGTADIIAFMDSDCEASPEWLIEGLAGFKAPEVGLVQGRTLPDPKAPHNVFSRTIKVEREDFLYETANIFYRREAFENSGGFLHDKRPNAERPLGGEDVDLAWKVKRAGWQSAFANGALVFHEVMPISVLRWFVNHRLYVLPKMLRAYPELRKFLLYGYFYDVIQVWILMALAGVVLAWFSLWSLVLVLPYIWVRGSETSKTLKGPLRLVRVLLYAPRDLASFVLLTAGSLRFGALIL